MSESVNLHMESMIPELEQMKRVGLFKTDEVRYVHNLKTVVTIIKKKFFFSDIVKKRKEFEYKIERTMKEKQDFLRYINYEVKLLREIKLRRDKLRIGDKKTDIEYSIAKRVVKLYQVVLTYFQSDVRMWMSYINFCTQTKFTTVVTQAFRQMLQIHADQKNLWLFAAKWEVSETKNIDGALNYLKTGLHHHPDSKELYSEAFKLELQLAEKYLNSNNSIEEQQDRAVARASAHFKAAVESIKDDIEFINSLLNIATDFEFTALLQREIADYLIKHYCKSEIMWDTMAQRELHGHNYDKKDSNTSTTQLCLAVYKQAVKTLPTMLMWEKYLDALIEIYHDERRNKNFKASILEKAFETAYDSDFLQEKHFLVWLELMQGDAKYSDILTKATEKIPNSLELWLMHIKYYSSIDDPRMVKITGEKAIETLKENSIQIYRSLIKYFQVKNFSTSETINLFKDGIEKGCDEVSLALRPMFIDWLSLNRNLKYTRSEYEKLANKLPYCLDLHKKMIDVEMTRFNPHIGIIRDIHKTACRQFGATKTEVWMDIIKFETEYGDAKYISDIYKNARNSLHDNLISVFTTDYTIFNGQ